MPRTIIGCDLSRAVVDLSNLPDAASSQVPNAPDAIAAWVASLRPDVLVVFQATSGCDGPLIAALAEGGVTFSRTNPRQAREFARAAGVLARTGRVDARVLARMGSVLDLPITTPTGPARSRLSDFLRRRRQLVDIRKAEKTPPQRRAGRGRRPDGGDGSGSSPAGSASSTAPLPGSSTRIGRSPHRSAS